ncbi:hypothetical protein HW132_24285 [Brasilonema sp. CT11]|nr:hypothetical protein [Brasilonema sp. CT11]
MTDKIAYGWKEEIREQDKNIFMCFVDDQKKKILAPLFIYGEKYGATLFKPLDSGASDRLELPAKSSQRRAGVPPVEASGVAGRKIPSGELCDL